MERLTTRNIAGVAVYKHPFECERCGETIWRLPDYGNGRATYVEKPISEKIAHDNEPKYKESNEEIAIWEMKQRIKALREQGLPESPD